MRDCDTDHGSPEGIKDTFIQTKKKTRVFPCLEKITFCAFGHEYVVRANAQREAAERRQRPLCYESIQNRVAINQKIVTVPA